MADDHFPVVGMIEGDGVVEPGIEALAIDAVDRIDRVGPGRLFGGQVQPPVANAGHGFGDFEKALLFASLAVGARQFELVDDDAREQLQSFQLRVAGARPGLGVDDAEGSKIVALLGGQGRSGVEANIRRARDQGIVREAGVQGGVFDDHHRMGTHGDGVGAKGLIARRLGHLQANLGLEPLPFFINQRNQRNGRGEEIAGQTRQPIDRRVGVGIQQAVGPQGVQPWRLPIIHAGSAKSLA